MSDDVRGALRLMLGMEAALVTLGVVFVACWAFGADQSIYTFTEWLDALPPSIQALFGLAVCAVVVPVGGAIGMYLADRSHR